ncbi:hypothetical protein [Capnocytophaga leadbetteri]|uniref:hypothetical protein n=1 Tax=Capnocytophaga leadbetteri TaxID=327575 RepID=UPI0028E1B407|nr:hypothetical protein [Capnocytophaga leadbetteri]
MEIDKLSVVNELVEYINDYYHEYITEDFLFLKKEILFISDFLPFIDLGALPFSIAECVQKQLSNLELEYNEFEIKATELKKLFFGNLSKYKNYIDDNIRRLHLENLLSCFFSNHVELEETILYYVLDDLLFFKVPEEIITGKLYQYFGDIIALKK